MIETFSFWALMGMVLLFGLLVRDVEAAVRRHGRGFLVCTLTRTPPREVVVLFRMYRRKGAINVARAEAVWKGARLWIEHERAPAHVREVIA